MAAEVLSNISSALATTFAPEITRTWNRTAVIAQNIKVVSGGGQGGGKQVAWDVEMDGASAAAFAEGSPIGAGELDFDPVVPATLPWGLYRAAFQLSNLEINAAAANMGNARALEDIVGERYMGKTAKLLSQINADIFSGTGTDGSGNPNIVGLNTALAATGSYAGINKATYSTWAGNVLGNGGVARPITMAVLAAGESLLFSASGFDPDFLMATTNTHATYESLFEATRRTVDSGQGPIPSYQGSTGRLYWRGKPVIRDRQNTAGSLYMLNSEELELRVLPFQGAADGVMQVARQAESSNGKDTSGTGISVHCYPLGRVGSGIAFVVEIYIQLRVKRPNAHLMITDITGG